MTIIKKVLVTIICLVVSVHLINYILTEEQPECSLAKLKKAIAENTTLTTVKSKWFPVQHCSVKGYVTTTNPGPNRVNFHLQLPTNKDWNGRYYFIGLGGGAGRTPVLSEAPFGNPVVSGFAVAGSDTGHQAFMLDWSFIANEAQALDHIHRGAHVSAVQTQSITKAFYNVDSMYRYHSGCSGGGRMGAMAATYHPEDFDGLLIGAPGIDSSNILNFMWIAQHIDKLPAKKFEKDKLMAMEKAIVAQCDTSDGVVDQMVWEPQQCDFDPSQLLCKLDQAENSCFTPIELEVIKAVIAGPHSLDGESLYPGLVTTNPSGWTLFLNLAAQMIGTSFSQVYLGDDFEFMTDFDFNDQADIDAWRAAVKKTGFGVRASADYSGVERAGAKALFWHGFSDPAISYLDQLNYFEEIREHTGDDERFNQFVSMYYAPGLFHCFGGSGPVDVPDRLLETLIDWVEKDISPGPVVTQRGQKKMTFKAEGIFKYLPNPSEYIDTPPDGTPAREFLLCPYPQKSVYMGNQSSVNEVYEADNWQCQLQVE